MDKIAGHVATIDRFDKNRDSLRGSLNGRPRQVFHVHGAVRGAKESRLNQSRHHVQPLVSKHSSVFQRASNARLEFLFASRQRGKTTLAFFPIAGRRVEEHLREPVSVKPGADFTNIEFIREQELDRAKSVTGCGLESIKERVLPIHHGQVGGEAWHRASMQLSCGSQRFTSSGRVFRTSKAPSTSIPASMYIPVRLFCVTSFRKPIR